DDTMLILIAVLTTFFLGEFVVAALAMCIYKIASVLITYFHGQLGGTIQSMADALPQYANLVDSGSNILRVKSNTLKRGNIIMVKAGETVPIDCTVLDGYTDFDTSNVYLSKTDISLSPGDKVLAGFVNNGASVTCEAICDYDESLTVDLSRLASMAEKKQSRCEKRFFGIAKHYPLITLILAVLTILIGGFSGGLWANAIYRACTLFIVATSGSYVAIVSLLSACAVWNLKKKGLAISTGDIIDELADVNCVAFEKNGILTDGEYKIKDIYTAEGISEDDFLMIAANCLGERQHPISNILTRYMNAYIPVENVIEFPGKGMECTIMNKSFLCGSESFLTECGVDVSEIAGYTIYVSIDGVIMGAMLIQDLVKPNSGESLRNLRQIGVEKIVMLSSERKETAELAYIDCGADEYFAELSPYGRVEVIQKLQKEENVTCLYIGDRLSSEQALDTAHVGLTLIGKEESGLEFSKAVLLGDLDTVLEAVEISRLACGNIELHFYCATALKIILILLSLFGALNIAAVIMIEALLTFVAMYSAKELLKK
ncbi:MAG: cation-translocating P-type ATPase, partial [Clostridia bacterium]|nr:cation-translocating P-type ATPase [Clostridia bacterium]